MIEEYGKEILKKSLVHFDDDIFRAGDKLVIPERAKILRIPIGIELKKTDIDIVKHDRYSVKYGEGTLKDEWERLKSESAQKMGVSSLDNLTFEQISDFSVKIASENVNRKKSKKGNTVFNEYPHKSYISFVLIEINGRRKILPVVLSISPIDRLLQNLELN